MFPIIPLFALGTILGSGGVLAWYSSLSRREQQEADARAGEYTSYLFEKQLDRLSQEEAHKVIDMTRRHFG